MRLVEAQQALATDAVNPGSPILRLYDNSMTDAAQQRKFSPHKNSYDSEEADTANPLTNSALFASGIFK